MTDQQRLGTQNSYSHKTKLGNWAEEVELRDERLKDFVKTHAESKLLQSQVEKTMSQSLTPVTLSLSQDGFVHVGDAVMLYSAKTQGVLSVDVCDESHRHETGFAVTTSTLMHAQVARNVFIIEGYGKDVQNGSVVKYGQPFRLKAHPKLFDSHNLYLISQPVSILSSSKVTRKQEVLASSSTSHDTIWMIQGKDVNTRFELEGEPVPVYAEVLIVHAQTRQALSSDLKKHFNDFGSEFEVSCYSNLDVSKKTSLYQELHGKTTADVPQRKESPQNHWAILTAGPQDPKAGASPADSSSADIKAPPHTRSLDANSEQKTASGVKARSNFGLSEALSEAQLDAIEQILKETGGVAQIADVKSHPLFIAASTKVAPSERSLPAAKKEEPKKELTHSQKVLSMSGGRRHMQPQRTYRPF